MQSHMEIHPGKCCTRVVSTAPQISFIKARIRVSRLQRHVEARTVKNPGIIDFAEIQPGRKTKPMERAEKEFDLEVMLTESQTGLQVQQLVTESPHKFDRDFEITCSTFARFAELTGRLAAIKKGADRSQARAFVDKLADLLLPHMNKMRSPNICAIVLALTQLGYAQPKLTQSVFYFLAEKERVTFPDPVKIQEADEAGVWINRKPKTIFSVGERVALLQSFAQLGVRPPPETITRVISNSLPFMKYCTPKDTANLVQALYGWRSQLHVTFADRLMFETRSHLPSLPSSALISLLSLVGAAGHVPSTYSARELLNALAPHLEGTTALPTPSLYPAAMDALIRLRVPMPPELFDVMITSLMTAPPAAKKKGKSAATKAQAAEAAAPTPCRLESLNGREVVVVLAALGLQDKYTPETGLVEKLLAHLQARVADLSASEAAAAVVLLPSVLTDADSRDDAAEAVDELLAVCEGGLGSISAPLLQSLSAALSGLGHTPDSIWSSSFDSEIVGRMRSAGAHADAAKAGMDRKQTPSPASPPPMGRPSLVNLVSALATLPGRKAQTTPALTSSELASFSTSLVSSGAFLGGFNDDQLQTLHKSLSSLGVKMSSVRLPIAGESDAALDSALEGTVGDSKPTHVVTSPAPEGEESSEGVPGGFIGYSPVDHDLEGLLPAVRTFRSAAEAAARSTSEGRERSRVPSSGSRAPDSQSNGWYGGEGDSRLDQLSDLLDEDWEVEQPAKWQRPRGA